MALEWLKPLLGAAYTPEIDAAVAQEIDKELAAVKLMAAVDAELTAAGSKNNTAVKAVLADFLKDASIQDGKVTSKVNGESLALAEKIEAMKKDAATDGHWKRRSCWAPRRGQAPALRCSSFLVTSTPCTGDAAMMEAP